MAAFTSIQNGDWNDSATWGGSNYPFETSASDTVTIAHNVTVTSGNPNAGTGAVTVGLGGNMIVDAACDTQSFCGAITVNNGGTLSSNDDTDTKELRVTGSVTVKSGGTLDLKRKTTLRFLCSSSGQYGLDLKSGHRCTLEGTDTDNRDCILRGDGAGKETWIRVLCEDMKTRDDWRNVTCDYLSRYDATYCAGISLYYANRYGDHSIISNVTMSNCIEHGLLLRYSNTVADWGQMAIPVAAGKYGLYVQNSSCGGGTWDITGTSGRGVYLEKSHVAGGKFNVDMTGGSGNPLYSVYSTISGGAFDLDSANGHGFYARYNTVVAGGVFDIDTASGYALHSDAATFTGGNIDAATTSNRTVYLINHCLIDGCSLTASATADGYYAFRFENPGIRFVSGALAVESAQYGVACYFGAAESVFRHSAEKHLIIKASNSDWYNNHVHCIEPRIYITDDTNRKFKIHFGCFPRNRDDFTVTGGTVDWDTTRGSFYVPAGCTVEFPEAAPWQVSQWGTINFTTAGAGASFTWEYALSNDGGATYSAWTQVASGADLSTLEAGGNGLDRLKIRVTVSGATGEIQEAAITGNYYTDIDGPVARNWLLPEYEPISQLPAGDNYWMRF